MRRIGQLPIAIGTDRGAVRPENQDRLVFLRMNLSHDRSLFSIVLCDGMGGLIQGDVCASLAASSFLAACITSRELPISKQITFAALEANKVVNAAFDGRGGATLSAVLIDSLHGIVGVNVGDSRIFGHSHGSLLQLTTDDTLAGQLKKNDNYQDHRRNELLQFIGIGEGLEPHLIFTSNAEDFFLITSDGIHHIESRLLEIVIDHAAEPAVAVRRLIDIASWSGGKDNASLALISPSLVSAPISDEIGIIQVWDPFGELQLVFFDPETNVSENQIVQDQPNQGNLPKKRARKRRNKPQQRDGKSLEIDAANDSTEQKNFERRPQLKIDFDEDDNG